MGPGVTGWEADETRSRKSDSKALAVVQAGSDSALEQGNGRDEEQWTTLRDILEKM